MKTMSLGILFLPEWILPWIILLGIAAWVVGARGLAGAAAALIATELFLAPLLAPWIESLPGWAMVGLAAALALMLLQGVIIVLFGRRAVDIARGTYLVRTLDAVTRAPFRFVRFLVRLISGRRT